MVHHSPADEPVASGKFGTVEWAFRNNGTCEAKEWLEAQPTSVQASFDHLFRFLAANGTHFPNPEQFKKMEGVNDVWQFKRSGKLGNRVYCFQHGRQWLLTNALKKGHGDQTAAARRARTIGLEHVNRKLLEIRKRSAR